MTIVEGDAYFKALSEAITVEDPTADIQKVLSSIVENVAKAVAVEACSLALITPDKRFLRHVASFGLSEEYVKKGRVIADQSISATLQGKPVAVLDAANDKSVQYPEEAQKEGIVSILSVPIILNDDVIGVLRVYSDQQRNFTDGDIQFVQTAASMGAVALKNAVFGDADESSKMDYDAFRQQLVELQWGRWPGQSS